MRAKKLLRLMGVSLLVMLVFGSIVPLFLAQQVQAQTNAVWINAATIRIGSTNLIDPSPGDTVREYTTGGSTSGCISTIRLPEGSNVGGSYTHRTRNPVTGDCEADPVESLTIGETRNADIWFHWVDSGRVEPVFNDFVTVPGLDSEFEGLGGAWAKIPGENVFVPPKGSCKVLTLEVVSPGSPGPPGSTLTPLGRGNLVRRDDGFGCRVISSVSVAIDQVIDSELPPGTGTLSSPEGDAGETDPTCESEGGVLSWIMCPMINLIDSGLNWIDTYIQALLEIDANYYDNEGMKAAFANIRNIAYLILVPVVLVMVIGTALGFDFVSAYTVKRAMPRLAVAVIFIALSYDICVFLIEFFNELGAGTLGIITGPFASVANTEDLSLASLFAGGILEGIASFIAGGTALLLILWFFGGTLFLFAAVAFLVLLLRQVFIVVFLLAAPLAILAWIFPGNDKLWKLWWGSFSKLLLMYPLIMAVIAVGRVFAFTIHEANGSGLDGTVLQPIMTIVAYTIPYAFIPFTFKFAGGVFSTVAGFANDRSKGLFDRQRKGRAERLQRFQQMNAFKGGTATNFRGRVNRALAVGSSPGALGYNPARWRGRAQKAMRDQSILGRENMLKDEEYTWKNNDNLNAIASLSNNEEELRALAAQAGYNLTEDQVADVESMRRKYGNSAFKQATWRRAAAGGTVFDRPGTGMLGDMSVWDAAARASGGDRAVLADLVGAGRGEMMNAGRADEGGGGFSDTYGTAERFLTGVVDPATGQRRAYTGGEARRDLTRSIYATQGASVLMHPSMKQYGAEAFMPRMVEDINEGVASGQADDLAHAMASVAFAYETGTNPNKTRAMRDQVMTQTIDIATLTPEMRQMIAPALLAIDPQTGAQYSRVAGTVTVAEALGGIRGSQIFQDFKREFQQAQLLAQQGQPPPPGAQAGGPPPGAPPGAPFGSDRRIKRNIQYLHTSAAGIRIYRFQYLWSDQTYVGVMAQEILTTHPEAVVRDSNGFYAVRYDLLGLEMLTYEEWQAQKSTKSAQR